MELEEQEVMRTMISEKIENIDFILNTDGQAVKKSYIKQIQLGKSITLGLGADLTLILEERQLKSQENYCRVKDVNMLFITTGMGEEQVLELPQYS